MSRILHLVNIGLRYGRSKGVRAYRQEEPPLGSLAAPCHLEESASHHLQLAVNRQTGYRQVPRRASLCEKFSCTNVVHIRIAMLGPDFS